MYEGLVHCAVVPDFGEVNFSGHYLPPTERLRELYIE